MSKHKGNQGKVCPECGANTLFLVQRRDKKDNVEYFHKYMDCRECGYSTEYKEKNQRAFFKDEFTYNY